MSEWDQRQLCSDGSCVGVIGPDGTCKVCGRAAPNWGEERKRGLIEPDAEEEDDLEDDDEYEDDDEDDGDGDGAGDEEQPAAAADPDWDKRKLCPDEACIGVIGSDGSCKVCGKRAA